MAILFNPWELQFLQAALNRWTQYKSIGQGEAGDIAFSELVASIRSKVQVASGVSVSLLPEESNFLQTLLYQSQQDYGRGSGNSVFEDTRNQVQQRSVQINNDILAKLRNECALPVNPGETEALES